jgi:hypothetical protein
MINHTIKNYLELFKQLFTVATVNDNRSFTCFKHDISPKLVYGKELGGFLWELLLDIFSVEDVF